MSTIFSRFTSYHHPPHHCIRLYKKKYSGYLVSPALGSHNQLSDNIHPETGSTADFTSRIRPADSTSKIQLLDNSISKETSKSADFTSKISQESKTTTPQLEIRGLRMSPPRIEISSTTDTLTTADLREPAPVKSAQQGNILYHP